MTLPDCSEMVAVEEGAAAWFRDEDEPLERYANSGRADDGPAPVAAAAYRERTAPAEDAAAFRRQDRRRP
jgi:hypothetical protein